MENFTICSDKKNGPMKIYAPTTFDELMKYANDFFTEKTKIRSYVMQMSKDSFCLVVKNKNGNIISHIIYSRGNNRGTYNTGYMQIDCSDNLERSIKELWFIMVCLMYDLPKEE